MRAPNRTQKGATLAELMVATIIMAIITSQALLLFSNQQMNYSGQGAVINIQHEARLVTEMMLMDVRMAGFLVPTFTGVSGRDGGTGGTDVLCLSDPSIIAANTIIDADRRLSGATLSAALTSGDTRVSLVATGMDIDGDGNSTDDFIVGNGIIISDGVSHHCALITSFTGGDPDIAPSPPVGFNINAGAGRAVPAIVYQVDAAGLLRNSVRLSRYVENLQVEYAIDANGNGSIEGGEFPIHDISASDPDQIKGMQLSTLTRTLRQDPANIGSRMPIAGNHVAGVRDNFQRRRFTTNVVPRNL